MGFEKIDRGSYSRKYESRAKTAKANAKRLKSPEARYTLVLHEARRRLGLTLNEYALADTIHKLSGTHSRVSGWCYASKAHLSRSLDVSERSVFSLINKLLEKKIIEQDKETSHLRTTQKWVDTVELIKTKHFSSKL